MSYSETLSKAMCPFRVSLAGTIYDLQEADPTMKRDCVAIWNLRMNKANGFIALHMGDMQRTSRWRIFGELLFTFAAHVLPADMLRKQFGFSKKPLLYHWSVACLRLWTNKWCGNSNAFCRSFEDGTFRVDTYMCIALPYGKAIACFSANVCGWQLGVWIHVHCHAG